MLRGVDGMPIREQEDNTTVYTIDQLRNIVVPIANNHGMTSVAVFGSYARGEADGESDIDLVVDQGGQRIMRIFGVGGEVELATGKFVDIYAWSELLPGPFRDTVSKEAIPL